MASRHIRRRSPRTSGRRRGFSAAAGERLERQRPIAACQYPMVKRCRTWSASPVRQPRRLCSLPTKCCCPYRWSEADPCRAGTCRCARPGRPSPTATRTSIATRPCAGGRGIRRPWPLRPCRRRETAACRSQTRQENRARGNICRACDLGSIISIMQIEKAWGPRSRAARRAFDALRVAELPSWVTAKHPSFRAKIGINRCKRLDQFLFVRNANSLSFSWRPRPNRPGNQKRGGCYGSYRSCELQKRRPSD